MTTFRIAIFMWALFGLALPLQAAATAAGTAPEKLEADFEMKNGDKMPGTIFGVSAAGVDLELRPVGTGVLKSVMPMDRIAKVKFRDTSSAQAALADATDRRADVLAAEWLKWRGFLALPGSPAPEVGLAYARELQAKQELVKAKELLTLISARAWDGKIVSVAKAQLQMADLMAGGAAVVLAKSGEILKTLPEPAQRSEAHLMIGQAATSELAAFLVENPRWTEDPLNRPEYHRLYNLAIDHFLQPYLTDGRNNSAAARGLLAAAQVYQANGHADDAKALAKDLQELYPQTTEAGLAARAYLEAPAASATP